MDHNGTFVFLISPVTAVFKVVNTANEQLFLCRTKSLYKVSFASEPGKNGKMSLHEQRPCLNLNLV